MRRLALLLALATPVVALGCGSDKAAGPAALAPADAFVYGEVDLAPEGETREAIENLISKFPGSGDSGQRIQRLLGLAFEQSKSGLSYEGDVKPWLGDRAAFFGSGIDRKGQLKNGAALIATDDEGKAEDAIEKAAKGGKQRSYKGRDYRRVEGSMSSAYYEDGHPPLAAGVVDGFVVAGTEGGFKQAVDVAEGESAIDGSDRYENATDKADTGGLAFVYVSIEGLLKSAEGIPSSLLGPYKRIFKEPYVATLDADAQGIDFSAVLSREAATALGPFFGEGTDLLGELPGDSWLALGQPKLGELLGTYVDLFAAQLGGRAAAEKLLRNAAGLDLDRDLLGWMGDFGLFVRGDRLSNLNGALVVETSDATATRRALAALRKALADGDDVQVQQLSAPGGGVGFTIRPPDPSEPVHLLVRDGKFVAAYGDEGVRGAFDPGDKLAEAPGFKDASASLGSGYETSFYAAVAPIFSLIENQVHDPGVAEAKPYVEPFEAIVGGTKAQGDKLESRSRVTVR